MPTITEWISPEIFVVYKGVAVFFTYKDDDFNQGVNRYYYTTDRHSDDNAFDVRELDTQGLLNNHPPFLAADCNPLYDTATEEQKTEWKVQWQDWLKDGGGEELAIKSVIEQAIEQGHITYQAE